MLHHEDTETVVANVQSEVGAVDSMETLCTNTPVSHDSSIIDLGQSSSEDKDLYTTRL